MLATLNYSTKLQMCKYYRARTIFTYYCPMKISFLVPNLKLLVCEKRFQSIAEIKEKPEKPSIYRPTRDAHRNESSVSTCLLLQMDYILKDIEQI